LLLLIFLINYSKHLFGQLIAAVVTLTCAYFGVVGGIYYTFDYTIAGIMLILNAFIRSGNNVK
jgi:hypothetical protein